MLDKTKALFRRWRFDLRRWRTSGPGACPICAAQQL